MHDSVQAFGREVLTPEMVTGKTVIEVGSFNVNGSLREYVESLKPMAYLGVDLRDGPGVDQVADFCDAEIEPKPCFDLVISTEMLEHAADWRAAARNMKAVLKPGGWLLLTTRSEGFGLHEYPGDFWRFSVDDMRRIFADYELAEVRSDPQAPGVLVLARKLDGSESIAVDLNRINVYSMESGAVAA